MYNRDMLLNTEFAALSGSSEFIAPGTLVDNRVVRFVRRGNKVQLVGVNYEIASARAPGIERSVEASSLPTILKVFNIVARGSGGDAVIDVTPLFASPPRAFAIGFIKHFGVRDIDPERSYIDGVKTFPENIGIRFYQTWVADRDELLNRVDDMQESVTASIGFMFYTNIYLLPEKPMRPRFWDPRVGYFATRFQDYGTGDFGGVSRGFIQRYRLEKKDPEGTVFRARAADRVLRRPRSAGSVAPVYQTGHRRLARRIRAGWIQARDRRAGRAQRDRRPFVGL